MEAEDTTITQNQYKKLAQLLSAAKSEPALQTAIVNAPFTDKLLGATLDLGIVVLLLVNKRRKTIDRIALSDTEYAQGAVKVSAKPFREILIPVGAEGNIIDKAIREQKYQITDDWNNLFMPALTPEEARLNQAGASIETSLVQPIKYHNGGALIFSFYQPMNFIGPVHIDFAKRYADLTDGALKRLRTASASSKKS